MRVAFLLLTLTILTGCTRALTPGEISFTEQLFGGTADASRVHFHDGAIIGKVTYQREKRPQLACRERIWPEPKQEMVTVGPAAITLFNKVFYARPFYTNDYFAGYPQEFNLYAAMLFAHELTHVWQWQNRAETGYSPLKAAREHDFKSDPYLYEVETTTRFADYAYEQQASIVEEYVCCLALDPEAPRTNRLEQLLKGAFPMQSLYIPSRVRIPWDGAKVEGICR